MFLSKVVFPWTIALFMWMSIELSSEQLYSINDFPVANYDIHDLVINNFNTFLKNNYAYVN